MSSNAIVGFVDILGYRDLVTRMISDKDFVERFDKLMFGISAKLKTDLRNVDLPFYKGEPADTEYFKKIVDAFKLRCIFDSLIFSLPIPDITFHSKEFDNEKTVLNCIETFFSFMAMVCAMFISKMGLIFRGGISIGPHYESERENYLFIFSEAHNKAVGLEEANGYPLIRLHDDLRLYLDEISYPFDRWFYKDEHDNYCLDIYSIFQIIPNKKTVLADIRNGLIANMSHNVKNEKRLMKLIHFAKYHNGKVRDEPNSSELVIPVEKFQKIF